MNYVRNAWYVAAWTHELEADKPTGVSILDEPIVLWRSNGKSVAHEDRCVHRLAPLSLGRCEGSNIRCMYHGFLFDADGNCVDIPGQDEIPPRAKIKKYPTVDRHGWTWVWMGDPEKADDRLVPKVVGPDDENWLINTGHLDYDADANLINHNLLDFSHIPFVHAASFQAPESQAQKLPLWEKIDRGLQYTMWTKNCLGTPAAPSDIEIDDLLAYDYSIPGIMTLMSGHFPVGTADECDEGRADFDKAVGNVITSSQAVTPVGKGKARYFFSIGPLKKYGNEAMRDMLTDTVHAAFAEDKVMIEAQQKIIEKSGDQRATPSVHDRAVTMFEQMVHKLNQEA